MKSERRHELQQNVLEAELARVWAFLKRRGNLLAWISLGVAVVVLGTVWYVNRTRSETEQWQSQFQQAVVPVGRGLPDDKRQEALEKAASERSQPLWAANANAILGDGISVRLATQWPSLSDGDRAALRAQAQVYYKRTIDEFPKEAAAVAKAHYGLGKLAENWNELDVARKEYQDGLAGGEALRGQPIAYLIQDALMRLDQFQGTVYMPASAPASGPASSPSSGPATMPGTGPSVSVSQPAGPAAPRSSTQPASAEAPPASTPAETPKSSPAKSN